VALALARGRLVDAAVGGAHPRALADGDPHLAAAVHHLLHALPPGHLEPHALLAAGPRVAPVWVVERERLLDGGVGNGGPRPAADERLHRRGGLGGERE